MTNEQTRVVKWLNIIGHTQDGETIEATKGQEVDGQDWTQIEDVVLPAADMIETMAAEADAINEYKEAAKFVIQSQRNEMTRLGSMLTLTRKDLRRSKRKTRKFASQYQQVSQGICGKDNATVEEILKKFADISADLVHAELVSKAAKNDLKFAAKTHICRTCLNWSGICKGGQNGCENGEKYEWRGL